MGGAMEQHSSKRQVDLDIYSFELASEMQIQEDQQIWAFTRLYWRLQRRCAPRGVVLPSDTRLIEVPPHLLEESICLLLASSVKLFSITCMPSRSSLRNLATERGLSIKWFLCGCSCITISTLLALSLV